METQTASGEEIAFSLKIPIELNEKIVADAEKNRRSRQQHIVFSLERLFETPNGNGKKEKTK